MVAPEEGAGVLDLGDDEAAGEGEAEDGIGGGAVLGDAELDVPGVEAGGAAEVIAAIREEGERDAALEEGAEGLGGDLDVAEEGDLGGVGEAGLSAGAGAGGNLAVSGVAGGAAMTSLVLERGAAPQRSVRLIPRIEGRNVAMYGSRQLLSICGEFYEPNFLSDDANRYGRTHAHGGHARMWHGLYPVRLHRGRVPPDADM